MSFLGRQVYYITCFFFFIVSTVIASSETGRFLYTPAYRYAPTPHANTVSLQMTASPVFFSCPFFPRLAHVGYRIYTANGYVVVRVPTSLQSTRLPLRCRVSTAAVAFFLLPQNCSRARYTIQQQLIILYGFYYNINSFNKCHETSKHVPTEDHNRRKKNNKRDIQILLSIQPATVIG